jgi:hypothetical protein
LISDHPNKAGSWLAANVPSPHVCTLLGQVYIKLFKNAKLVESREFSNEAKLALNYHTESRKLKEQDNLH